MKRQYGRASLRLRVMAAWWCLRGRPVVAFGDWGEGPVPSPRVGTGKPVLLVGNRATLPRYPDGSGNRIYENRWFVRQ